MIDPAKTYRTRDGREVRIYAVDGGGSYPIHGAVITTTSWLMMSWRENGKACSHDGEDANVDLIEAKPKHVRWLNIYPKMKFDCVHESKDRADQVACADRLACIRIEFEEGEGL